MRIVLSVLAIILLVLALLPLLYSRSLPAGMSLSGADQISQARFLGDITWVDDQGQRHSQQEIFEQLFQSIARAQRFILLDMFLYNSFQGPQPENHRELSTELTEALLNQKKRFPDMDIVVVSDPVNTVYGALPSPHFEALRAAGIEVILTDLDQLPDSNRVYSALWRTLIRPFGVSKGSLLANPFGEGRVSIRAYLKLFNFKANHRKLLVCDEGKQLVGLVMSANPHDGSSAHGNVAVQFYGKAVDDLLRSEQGVLDFSGRSDIHLEALVGDLLNTAPAMNANQAASDYSQVKLKVITERKIKRELLSAINQATAEDSLDVLVFYLSDEQIINALIEAKKRDVQLRVLLDPNKDAFGLEKNGVPNRPVAHLLNQADIPVRWCNTQGEQCHSKMLLTRFSSGEARLILGSANFTRRNLDDLNLETDVAIQASVDSPLILKAAEFFDQAWFVEPSRIMSLEYEHYADESTLKQWQYRFMEASGLSTF